MSSCGALYVFKYETERFPVHTVLHTSETFHSRSHTFILSFCHSVVSRCPHQAEVLEQLKSVAKDITAERKAHMIEGTKRINELKWTMEQLDKVSLSLSLSLSLTRHSFIRLSPSFPPSESLNLQRSLTP